MNFQLPLLGLGIVIALIVVMAIWFISASSRAIDKRREELKAKRVAYQPWDAQSADGRGNR